jgi:hypothetical protein
MQEKQGHDKLGSLKAAINEIRTEIRNNPDMKVSMRMLFVSEEARAEFEASNSRSLASFIAALDAGDKP